MILLKLPWLSERFGHPVLAAVEPPLGLERDDDVLPPDAQVFHVRCPSSRFMAHVPNTLPSAGGAGQQVAWERWVDLFLARAIADPPMKEADVQEMGPDRDVLAHALLRLWSWIPEADGSLPNMPGEPFQDILRFLSGKLRRAPSEILDMPFDAFVLNYRVLRTTAKPGGLPTADPDSDGVPAEMFEMGQ